MQKNNHSFISKAGGKASDVYNTLTSGLKNPASWLMEYISGGSESSSGVVINLDTALGIPEVWYAISKLSSAVAGMPLLARKRGSDGYGRIINDDPGAKLWEAPCEGLNHFSMVENLLVDAVLLGNGRLLIERDALGRPVNLIPLSAYNTQTLMVDGEKFHYVSGIDEDSSFLGGEYEENVGVTFSDEDVIHIMNLSINGAWGVNLLEVQKDTFGLSIGGLDAQASTYRQAGKPGLVLTAPKNMFTQEDAQDYMEGFRKNVSSMDDRGKAVMIRQGMEIQSLKTAPDVEATDSRQFQREAVALVMMLEQIIGDGSGNVYGSLAEKNAAWLQHGLGRWLNKIESECNSKLLSIGMRRAGIHYDFNTDPLFRADKMGILGYTQGLRTQGVISTNEVRMAHGLEPVEDEEYNNDFYAGLATASHSEEAAEEEVTEEETQEPPESPEEGVTETPQDGDADEAGE